MISNSADQMLRHKTILDRRVHFKTLPNGLQIDIERQRNQSPLLVVWCICLWAFAFAKVIPLPRFYSDWKTTLLAWLFLSPFYIFPFVMIWMFTSAAYEEQTLSIESDHLRLQKRVLWHTRDVSLPARRVSALRIVKRWPDGLVKYVAFDCLGKTYRFGTRILTDEADEVISKLKGYLPHAAS